MKHIKLFESWLNESLQIPYVTKGDIVDVSPHDNTYEIDEALDFLDIEDDNKIVCLDPDTEKKSDYDLLDVILSILQKNDPRPARSINGDNMFDEYICYDDFEDCGRIVRAHHSDGQYNCIMTNGETYMNLLNRFRGSLHGKKFGL
jgi:hypothetical protein